MDPLEAKSDEFFFIGGATCSIFKVNGDQSFLPFPINQHLVVRVLICSVLAAILSQGLKKRFQIFAFLRSPEVKMNPPNFLFALDQVNGVFLALIIIFRITFNLLPMPLSDLAHPKICAFAEVMSGSYISGTIVWRCYTAILKLSYVKAQIWLHNRIGVNTLLIAILILGLGKMALFSFAMSSSENDSYVKRSCFHRNAMDLEILYGFEVRFHFTHLLMSRNNPKKTIPVKHLGDD